MYIYSDLYGFMMYLDVFGPLVPHLRSQKTTQIAAWCFKFLSLSLRYPPAP